jgi:hypothetical protein
MDEREEGEGDDGDEIDNSMLTPIPSVAGITIDHGLFVQPLSGFLTVTQASDPSRNNETGFLTE